MTEAQQQRRRRTRAGGALVAAAALAALVAGLPLAAGFLGAGGPEVGRRAVLAGAAGALVAGVGGTEARAQLQPSLPGANLKKKKKKELTEEELTTLIRNRLGSNLGKIMNLKDQCLYYGDVPDDPGWTANIGTDGVIVWDQDEPCPAGEVYIIGSARGELLRMSATNGPTKHKFVAGTFEYPVVKEFKNNIGKCVKAPQEGEDFVTWEIANMARGGKCS